jgi:hypothetical protein
MAIPEKHNARVVPGPSGDFNPDESLDDLLSSIQSILNIALPRQSKVVMLITRENS